MLAETASGSNHSSDKNTHTQIGAATSVVDWYMDWIFFCKKFLIHCLSALCEVEICIYHFQSLPVELVL